MEGIGNICAPTSLTPVVASCWPPGSADSQEAGETVMRSAGRPAAAWEGMVSVTASVSIAAREGANRARQNSEAVERAVRGGTEGCWGGKGWVPLVQPQRGALQDTEGIPTGAEGPPGWDHDP